MKQNKIDRHNTKRIVAIIAIVVLAIATISGVVIGYQKLRDVWMEQCVITDVFKQVIVTNSGKMVKADAIREAFGLKNGINLAKVDFAQKREEVLKKYPTIRLITITRHLPNYVEIAITERDPAVRMNVQGKRNESGRVADTEGVVFPCRRNVSMLPIIREKPANATMIGKSLTGNALAALQLIEAAKDPELSALGVLEVDAGKQDFLLVTLGNYSRAKVAWEGMGSNSEQAKKAMISQLSNLLSAINSGIRNDAKIWNATLPNQVFSDNQRGN